MRNLAIVGAVVVAFGLVVGGFATFVVASSTTHPRTEVICFTERDATSNGAEYGVYTAAGHTYKMADSMLGMWRTNTADDYGRLTNEVPGTFDITYKGWRIGFASEFPNLLKFHKVSSAAPGCGNVR